MKWLLREIYFHPCLPIGNEIKILYLYRVTNKSRDHYISLFRLYGSSCTFYWIQLHHTRGWRKKKYCPDIISLEILSTVWNLQKERPQWNNQIKNQAQLYFRPSIFFICKSVAFICFLYRIAKTEKGVENAATDAAAYVPSLAVCRAVEILSLDAWSRASFCRQYFSGVLREGFTIIGKKVTLAIQAQSGYFSL